MTQEPWNWKREDLDNLIGQAESLRLDFKQSRLFLEKREKIAEDLSAEVSAFANTEGGTIVIGVAEVRNGKARIAASIDDGVDIHQWSPERLQQMIEANVSPHLSGLRVKGILLSNAGSRMAFVVHVPQGTTAYQANDRRYYGRSEYESKPLPDHEVRLRMFRGKVPSGIVIVTRCSKNALGGRSVAELEEVSKLDHELELSFLNTGEINVTELKARFAYENDDGLLLASMDVSIKDGWMVSPFPYGSLATPPKPMRVNVYPQDSYVIKTVVFSLPAGKSLEAQGLVIHWILHLPNSQPTRGAINVADEFRRSG